MLRNCSPQASACAARPWAQPLKIMSDLTRFHDEQTLLTQDILLVCETADGKLLLPCLAALTPHLLSHEVAPGGHSHSSHSHKEMYQTKQACHLHDKGELLLRRRLALLAHKNNNTIMFIMFSAHMCFAESHKSHNWRLVELPQQTSDFRSVQRAAAIVLSYEILRVQKPLNKMFSKQKPNFMTLCRFSLETSRRSKISRTVSFLCSCAIVCASSPEHEQNAQHPQWHFMLAAINEELSRNVVSHVGLAKSSCDKSRSSATFCATTAADMQ